MEGDNAMANSGPAASVAAVAAMRLSEGVAESLKLEHQLMKVPLEHLKKSMRANHRLVEKEVNAVVAGVTEAAEKNFATKEDAVRHLNTLVSRLHGLKRKLEENYKTEGMEIQKSRARLNHLESLQNGDKEFQRKWNDMCVDRILVDYMLRSSYYDTAAKLAEASNIQDLVDIDTFADAKKVVEKLKNQDCSEALLWCSENKSKLKRAKSKFEFKLRIQEFIELVRREDMMGAIRYARKYLAPWGSTDMKDLQQAMATLAFKSNTECPGYKILFDKSQWDNLIHKFKQEFCKLYRMTLEPLLNIYLQAGLSALKTPFCYEENCTKEDPLSQETFKQLALSLPFSKHIHSKLVCYITNQLMDENNPPMVLPNGYVYSKRAMEDMARRNNNVITCPRTGYVCNFADLAKAYIS